MMSAKERTARPGGYRVIGVDTFDGTDWIAFECFAYDAAVLYAKEETTGKQMLKMHIYDDQGRHCGDYGSF